MESKRNSAVKLTSKDAAELISSKLSRFFGVTDQEATSEQIYRAVAMSVREMLLEKRKSFQTAVKQKKAKRVYYLCMEFLLGRSLKNNLYNLGIEEPFAKALSKKYNINIDDLYELEPDAGLGNGGLGRLAACFMDGLASQNYPAMGFSLCYEYGLFKQRIVDGWQMELPDVWLPGGDVWLNQREDRVYKVKFDGRVVERQENGRLIFDHVDAQEIEAVAYDMLIPGKDSDAVSILRLWKARSTHQFDMYLFSQGSYMQCMKENNEADVLTKVLYPSDNHFEGKTLRIKQQYFLVSATLQYILDDHFRKYGTYDNLAEKAAIHINDTHPAFCVPELMRLLMDEHGYSWDDAWNITSKTIAYTNHTIMSEALEKWDEKLIGKILPRIDMIMREINRRFCDELTQKYPGDWDRINSMSIYQNGQVRMANLSIVGSHCVNGVSALHSEIIKKETFANFAELNPDKFTNVTNGIAHRRWLCQSNKELCELLNDCIGDGYVMDASKLSEFKKYENDSSVLQRLNEIKQIKKKQLADYAFKRNGVVIDPNTMFDVQAKRMHEYKRQLLNAMYIVNLYNELKANPDLPMQPKTFIFGAKAAPGYYIAKEIIRLICYISEDIKKNPNPKIREKLNVVYLEDYNVTLAEKLMPATEISEQISQAGKEASGTGNMKFMINGALTIGTEDGANVEMHKVVGDENIFIFGLDAQEVGKLAKHGYNSISYYNSNVKLREVVDSFKRGYNGQSFDIFSQYLLNLRPVADPYMCMADFGSYLAIHEKADNIYKDKEHWAKMSLNNIAGAGIFSADRAIREYAENIWHIKPVKTDK